MKRKSNKKFKISIKKYTALAPKTIKATKAVAVNAIKKINFLHYFNYNNFILFNF